MKAARRSLSKVLGRIVSWSTVLPLLVIGLALVALFCQTVCAQREANVRLLARTVAYAAEASLMFGDRQTATEILNGVIAREGLCRISIYPGGGPASGVFAQVARQCEEPPELKNALVSSLLVGTVQVEVIRDGRRLGTVEMVSDDAAIVGSLYRAAAVLAVCLVLVVLMARVLARLMRRSWATELSSLMGMARAARLEGDFSRRLPAFEITEFNGLAQDFNALLGEVQSRNAELRLRQSHLDTVSRTLSSMAMSDSLTGLANRACFNEQLEIAVSRARENGTRVGVLYINNDHFKDINDSFGQAAGDSLLVNVGKRLSGAVRESDLVARLGGDEFAVLLTPVSGEDDLRHVSNKVLAAMSRKLRLGEREGQDVVLGVSVGMVVFPEQANDAASLLRAAEGAMYRAKRLGRGRACMYDPAIDATPTKDE